MALIRDFVIQRADGTPIFFLANAVDDIDMGITHVIRGEDLLDSTHRVLALRDALGRRHAPVYAHLPLIVDAATAPSCRSAMVRSRSRSSARRATSPKRSTNYLALQGWAPAGADSGDEIRRERAGRGVRLDHVHARGRGLRPQEARLDERRVDPAARRSTSSSRGVEPDGPRALRRSTTTHERAPRLRSHSRHERAVTLDEIVDGMAFLFVDDADFAIAPDSWEKVVGDRAGRGRCSTRSSSTCAPATGPTTPSTSGPRSRRSG